MMWNWTMNYNNEKLNEIYRDTWPNLGWAAKANLPKKDDAPWLNTTYDGFMTHEEMLEEAARREAANKQIYPDGDYIESFPHVTRVEVIGKKGREFTQYDCFNVQVSMQDQGRTIKVFLS